MLEYTYILTGLATMPSGIYGIRNKVTEKYYIGSTRDFSKRWSEHKYHLKRGTHHSIKLQRSYDKHGVDSFEFSILKEVEDLDQLQDVEEEFIQLYQSWLNGYNVLKRGAKLGEYEEGTVRNVSEGEYTTRRPCVGKRIEVLRPEKLPWLAKDQRLNVQIPKDEMDILRGYCKKYHRSMSDVIRAFVRALPG
jgi:group I intron endonuclease